MRGAAQSALGYSVSLVGTTAVFYYGAAYFTDLRAPTPLQPSVLDHAISFQQWALIPYLSLFVMIWATFVCLPGPLRSSLLRTGICCACMAGPVFLWWPTVVDPVFKNEGLAVAMASTPWLSGLTQLDTPANCLPSLHAALSVSCALAITCCRVTRWTIAWWGWVALIVWSAISLRQHLAIDLAAGAALAIGVWAVVTRRTR